jgi:hypothetical protein
VFVLFQKLYRVPVLAPSHAVQNGLLQVVRVLRVLRAAAD